MYDPLCVERISNSHNILSTIKYLKLSKHDKGFYPGSCTVYLGIQHQELGDKILSMGRDMFKVGQIHCVITAESFGHRSVSAMSLVER